ncbi:MAG: Nif3-like dinuclear metal center hexameric protein [Bacteroidales bacterium]|nr:Nif3-like dinuclear metal center hexameric protein [Bacteroidales bacterium]
MRNYIFLIFLVYPFLLNAQIRQNGESQKAESIIAEIIKQTASPSIAGTVDVIKEGKPDSRVTGIICCMFATMDVLKAAVANKCNMIVTHEPIYFNHLDEVLFFEKDPVFIEKQRYIREHELIIWRFHDYIHSMKPDGIRQGMCNKLKWNEYATDSQLEHYKIPELTLDKLLIQLSSVFPGAAFNVIGDRNQMVSNIWLAPGASGMETHVRMLGRDDADVVIAGECPQWETYEYARESVLQGRKKAVIFLGHIPSEEAGMEYCAGWLKTFIADIPILFIPSGPSYFTTQP